MRKLRILLLIVLLLFALCGFQTVFAEEEIRISFFDGEKEIFPNIDNGVYFIEYSEDLELNISGSLTAYPNAESVLRIKQGDNLYVTTDKKTFSDAGTYELMIEVKGGVVKSKTFTLIIEKKKVTDAYFDKDTLSIRYGEKSDPLLILPESVYGNAMVEYRFYRQDGTEIEKVDSVGEYKVKGVINGKNYYGEIEDTFIVNKADCYIEVENNYVEVSYKLSEAGVNGYDLQEMFGVSVKNTEIDYPLVFEVKGNNDKDFYESRYIRKVDSYLVNISFKGNVDCFENGNVTATFILKKSDISFSISNYVTVIYDNELDIVKSVRDDMYNNDYGYSVYGGGEKLGVDFSSALLSIAFYEDSSCQEEMRELPKNAREECYYYKLFFEGNDYFNGAESKASKLIIQRRNIIKEISVKSNIAYSCDEEYDILKTFSLPSVYSEKPLLCYYKIIENGEGVLLEEKPSKPGSYYCLVTIDSSNYYASFNVRYSIDKLSIPIEKLVVSGLEFTYGDTVSIAAEIKDFDIQDIDISYYLNTVKLEATPINAGVYVVCFSVVDDNYILEAERELVIHKKELGVAIAPIKAAYGDDIFVKSGGVYQDDCLSYEGLVLENDEAELNSVISLFAVLGEQKLYTKSPLLTVGSYTVKAEGEHRNYDISYGEGILTVEKRSLNVSVGNVEQYVGYKLSPKITVSNTAYNDLGRDYATLFECYYTESSGREVTDLVDGRYIIKVRLKSQYEGSSSIANYKMNYINGILTLLSNEKTDEEGNITIIGKFSSDEDFKVRTDISVSNYSKAIQKTSGKADVTEFYYVPYALPTTDGSSFKLRLKSSSLAKEGVKLLVSYDGIEFIEQEFVVVNGQMELSLNTMPSYYAVCVPEGSNLFLLVGLIVGGIVVVVAVVLIVLWRLGTFVKAKKKDGIRLSEGVIAPTEGRKTEDDELDEIIESFDYNSVKKEENPAERLARKESEELRAQYRLKLRRMRNMGDKSISDTMSTLGVDGASYDEEKAITMLIEADETKRKKEDEEKRKIKEKEEAIKKEETSFVVNERKIGTLSGRRVVPKTPHIDDDDF